jgi:integrase
MILLAINGGFGNSDCEQLPIAAVNLDTGWVRFPRPKTEVPRAFPLWPETVEALKASLAKRPSPKSEADAGLFFITKYGQSWHKAKERGPVVLQFRRLLDDLGLHKPGRGFYSLRHAFETIGGESKDQAAVDAIMGHLREDMASHYRERISDDRLRGVVETVRNWLFPVANTGQERAPAKPGDGPQLRVVG